MQTAATVWFLQLQSDIKTSSRQTDEYSPVSHALLLSEFRRNRRYMTDWRQKHQSVCVGGWLGVGGRGKAVLSGLNILNAGQQPQTERKRGKEA